jgi:hypothetical protein
MVRTLPVTVTQDNTNDLRMIRSSEGNLERTINISLERESADRQSFIVRAWGRVFPADGGAYVARLPLPQQTVDAAISDCWDTWREVVIEKVYHGRKPYLSSVDQRSLERSKFDDIMISLAEAGDSLFRVLFSSGDKDLDEIRNIIVAALLDDEQVISFHSEDVLAPWSMLYVTDPDARTLGSTGMWQAERFLGYKHLIEHQFRRVTSETLICAQDSRVWASLNVDDRIDRAGTAFVRPVEMLLQSRAQVCGRRTDKRSLADAFKSREFRDQIIYFGCHGHVVGSGASGRLQGELRLADDKAIRSSDIISWLEERLPSNPVVIVNACAGGAMGSPFYTTFARDLLARGANCLVGPQIDIPICFAADYAVHLLDRFLVPQVRLGGIVRELSRTFLDDYSNPLGLTYSLYRGMDTRLA